MAKRTSDLADTINKLRDERQQHVDAVDEIDAFFTQFGISTDLPRSRRRRPGGARGVKKKGKAKVAKKKTRKKVSKKQVAKRRGKKKGTGKARKITKKRGTEKRGNRVESSVSGPQHILDFVRKRGNPTTSQINAHWGLLARSTPPNVVLGKLVGEGKLKRQPISGQRGSQYTLP